MFESKKNCTSKLDAFIHLLKKLLENIENKKLVFYHKIKRNFLYLRLKHSNI